MPLKKSRKTKTVRRSTKRSTKKTGKRIRRKTAGVSKMFYDIAVKRSSGVWQTNKGRRRKQIWASVSDGYLYLSYDPGRSYWVLRNFRKGDVLPKITANDKTLVLRINTYAIKFKKEKDFAFAKKYLVPWSR